jgi:hypothetical protein
MFPDNCPSPAQPQIILGEIPVAHRSSKVSATASIKDDNGTKGFYFWKHSYPVKNSDGTISTVDEETKTATASLSADYPGAKSASVTYYNEFGKSSSSSVGYIVPWPGSGSIDISLGDMPSKAEPSASLNATAVGYCEDNSLKWTQTYTLRNEDGSYSSGKLEYTGRSVALSAANPGGQSVSVACSTEFGVTGMGVIGFSVPLPKASGGIMSYVCPTGPLNGNGTGRLYIKEMHHESYFMPGTDMIAYIGTGTSTRNWNDSSGTGALCTLTTNCPDDISGKSPDPTKFIEGEFSCE